MFLDSQNQEIWTHSYSVVWSKKSANAKSWELTISHIDDNQKTYESINALISENPVKYFINSIEIQFLILSAMKLKSAAVLINQNLETFSARAILRSFARSASRISFSLVQDMSYVTKIYTSLKIVIKSSVFFCIVIAAESSRDDIFKYRITLEDDKNWLFYAKFNDDRVSQFSLISNFKLQDSRNWSDIIQIAKNSDETVDETIYDDSVEVLIINVKIVDSTNETTDMSGTSISRIDFTTYWYCRLRRSTWRRKKRKKTKQSNIHIVSNSIEISFLAWYKRLNVVSFYSQRIAFLHYSSFSKCELREHSWLKISDRAWVL